MATSEAQIDELIDDLVTSFPPKETEPVKFLASSSTEDSPGCTFRSAKEDSGNALRSAVRVTHDLEVGRAVGHWSQRHRLRHGRPDARDPRHHGAEEPFLRPLFTGEEIWCQLSPSRVPVRTSPVWPVAPKRTATSGS